MKPLTIRTIFLSASVLCGFAGAQITGPITQWIEAENFSAKQGGVYVQALGDMGVDVHDLGNGNWLRFDNINFLQDQYDTVTMFWWSQGSSGPVRFRLDSPTATPIASITSFGGGAGGPGTWNSDSVRTRLSAATGVHSLYMTIEGSASWLRLDKIRLTGRLTAAVADAKTYYVATNGNDGNDGLSLTAPFRTIQHAASVMRPGSTCKIRQGIYRETVRPACTGLPGAPLTFENYNGENAVISGADPITGWTVHSGSIYKAPMRWTLGEYRNQVLMDGKMAWMAQCPNVADSYVPSAYVCWGNIYDWELYKKIADEPLLFSNRVCMDGRGAILTNPAPGTAVSFAINNTDATHPVPGCIRNPAADYFKGGLMTVNNCVLSTAIITGSGTSGTQTIINASSLSAMIYNTTAPGWISHVFELLDSPNEWFFKDSTLYLWAPDGGDPSHHLVEAKKRLLGFDLSSKQYVNLIGIRIIGASLSMDNASYCIIDSCHFKYVSHADTTAKWDMGPGFQSLGCPWYGADGHGGIYMSGRENIIKNCSVIGSSAAGIVMLGRNNTVTNCIVRCCNYSGGGGWGAITTWRRNAADPNDGYGFRINHNTTKFNTWANIRVGQAVLNPANDRDRCKVQYNDFGASSWMSAENGSLAGQNANSVDVSYNWFHGVAGFNTGDVTFESDVGALHWIVHHNVFWQGKFADGECAVDRGYLRCCSWTFSWWDTGSSAQVPNSGGGMCFNNTVVDSVGTPHKDWEYDWPGYKRNNIMAKCDTAPWMFADPVHRDYSLRAGSPAIDKGVVIPGWVETYHGTAPDLGAYEFSEPRWVAGADWKDQPWVYPPADISSAIPYSGRTAAAFQPRLMMLTHGMRIDNALGVSYRVTMFSTNGTIALTREAPRGGTLLVPLGKAAPGIYCVRIMSRCGARVWKILIK